MAAWDDDLVFDRKESHGQQCEADGEPVTEAFYPCWTQPSHVILELRAELLKLDALLDDLMSAA